MTDVNVNEFVLRNHDQAKLRRSGKRLGGEIHQFLSSLAQIVGTLFIQPI